ncbi:N-acyl homoserine lactonase family protein [Larkinella sp. VNQ87]|uniref:N-acyl homoserine lactonase family protein n=1 Tax=Larkinella sp. VNQ87 TaxID=3400921 RepID=UPI003BFF58A1
MDSIKIHVLHCGSIDLDEAVPYYTKTLHPAPYTGIFRSKKHQMIVPVSAYLIEHPKGLILIDTGWHTEIRSNPKKYLGWLYSISSTAHLQQGKAIHEQLETLGYKPEDLDYLFLSHLHPDHVSGLKLVSKAKRILTSDLELKDVERHPLLYKPFMWQGVNVQTFHFENSEYDLFDDKSVILVNTPGHTNGMASTLIQNNGKFVLLCADTGYTKKAVDKLIIPGMTTDKKKALTSLRWIKEMSEKSNCIEVIANHDPEVKPHTIEL